MAANSIRAFSDPNCDYYELTRDLEPLTKGTIFYHDKNDSVYGSVADGCLKNCWTPEGGCYGGLCGGTVIFHSTYAKTDLFEKVDNDVRNLVCAMKPGKYTLNIYSDGSWNISSMGNVCGNENMK